MGPIQVLIGHSYFDRRELAQSDYDEDIKPLIDKYKGRLPADLMTFERFSDAASLVASRAFGVDGWHGDRPLQN